ncbi:MAG: hypothetical protein HYZ49_00620 [Chloroflexi bacterium]|nr:hypothetical protein [Chloroflexota bacterium]
MQRLLIVGQGNLFDEGLRRLLSSEQADLEVLRIIYRGEADVLQWLTDWRPGTVVLFEGGPLTVGRLFELSQRAPGLGNLRVITMLAEISVVEVYEKQQVSTVEGDDLFELIEDKNV